LGKQNTQPYEALGQSGKPGGGEKTCASAAFRS
jgi:hypothetical protein